MANNLCSGFAIQNTFMSTTIIGRMVLQRHYPLSVILLTSLSILDNCRLWDEIFFNEGTAGVLGNT